ncbi:MAG TPA: hypothetical protein VN458_00150 [Solirubrobacterales bacterium]|nr:hypothetical protein [Solirubrobacterales bacterium]
MSERGEELLESINQKLGVLLVMVVNERLEEKRQARNLDQLLARAGLGSAEIAEYLGKTQRAVQKAIKE